MTPTRRLISETPRITAFALVLFMSSMLGGSAAAQPVTSAIAGAVSVPAPDGQPFVVPGVTLTLACGAGEPKVDVSNERGEFKFADVPTGVCVLTAELQGFKSATANVTVTAGDTATVAIQLGLETLHEEVTVRAQADPLEANPIEAHVERIGFERISLRAEPIRSKRTSSA